MIVIELRGEGGIVFREGVAIGSVYRTKDGFLIRDLYNDIIGEIKRGREGELRIYGRNEEPIGYVRKGFLRYSIRALDRDLKLRNEGDRYALEGPIGRICRFRKQENRIVIDANEGMETLAMLYALALFDMLKPRAVVLT